MVRINMYYEGNLRVHAKHEPSGAEIITDAPKDNHGMGQSFSPTDLIATAMGTCMATIMGIIADQNQADISGMQISVEKIMKNEPFRKIASLPMTIRIPDLKDVSIRKQLEDAALMCPVCLSLDQEIERPVKFIWE